VIIYLGHASRQAANDLTRGLTASEPLKGLLFDLSSGGVCHAEFIAEFPVVSYTTFSPLLFCEERFIFCGTIRLELKL